MRELPSEVMRACPNCRSMVGMDYGVKKEWSEDDDFYAADLIGITCSYCATELHLYWFVNQFEPAMATIDYDYDVIDFDEITGEEDMFDDYLYDEDDESIAAWENRMLCCNADKSQCACSVPVSWKQGVRGCLEQFDILEDFYEYSDNKEAYQMQQPSCMNCVNYAEASCIPLRNRMYDYVISAAADDPIHICQDYFYDHASYNRQIPGVFRK